MQMGSSNWWFLQWIAWRNLVSRRNRHGLSFMTTISIMGVALGVAALIIVLSVMGGFEQELKEKMLRGQPHVEVLGQNAVAGFPMREYPLQTFRDHFPGVTGVEPFTQADVVMKQGKHLSAVVLFGIDPNLKADIWSFERSMATGRLEAISDLHTPIIAPEGVSSRQPGVILGEALAGQLGAEIGDEITILSPQAESSSTVISGGTVSRQYVMVGTFQTGLFNYDSKLAVVSLAEGRKFMPEYEPSMDDDEYVTGIAFNLQNPYDLSAVSNKIKDFPNLKIKTWQDTNASMLFALKLEKFTMGAILMLIVVVAAFSISGTMMMTVFHKKTQVCLYRSLGMNKPSLAKLFIYQGFTIGSVGIVLGLALGLGTCILLFHLRTGSTPVNLFYLRALPVKFLPQEYAIICVSAWALSILGALYPAMTAARQDPSSGMRY